MLSMVKNKDGISMQILYIHPLDIRQERMHTYFYGKKSKIIRKNLNPLQMSYHKTASSLTFGFGGKLVSPMLKLALKSKMILQLHCRWQSCSTFRLK